MLRKLKEKLFPAPSETKSEGSGVTMADVLSETARQNPGKIRLMSTMPRKGFVWNPVRKYPVNHGCFCGSGKKAKKCCLPYLAPIVSESFAQDIKAQWEKIITGHVTLPPAPRNQ